MSDRDTDTPNHEKLQLVMRYWLHGKCYYRALEAMEFASRFHTGFRKDGSTPEFHHQVSIASFLRTLPNLRFPEETLATCFLHDVVEDYNISIEDIETKFGKSVSYAVALLSKKIGGYETKNEFYYKKMSNCPIASIVKGGDRMHNFQTMPDVFTAEKQSRYIAECKDYIMPMLKESRRRFPDQEPAYENIKHVLLSQIGLLEISLRHFNGE